jgi:hypothetical protein
VTGLKVPMPTCRVTLVRSIPASARASSRGRSKWSPAVGAGLGGPDGLVALAIGRAVGAFDVRRQRHVAEGFELVVEGARELDHATTIGLEHLGDLDLEGGMRALDHQAGAGPGLAAGARQRFPAVSVAAFDQQQLDAPAVGGVREDPRRDHPSVVDHQQIAGAQQRRQVTDVPVADRPDRRKVEQTALAPWRRILGDQLVG